MLRGLLPPRQLLTKPVSNIDYVEAKNEQGDNTDDKGDETQSEALSSVAEVSEGWGSDTGCNCHHHQQKQWFSVLVFESHPHLTDWQLWTSDPGKYYCGG